MSPLMMILANAGPLINKKSPAPKARTLLILVLAALA